MRYYPSNLARNPDVRKAVALLTPAQRKRGLVLGQSAAIHGDCQMADQFSDNLLAYGANVIARERIKDLAGPVGSELDRRIEDLYGFAEFFIPSRKGNYYLWLPVRAKRA